MKTIIGSNRRQIGDRINRLTNVIVNRCSEETIDKLLIKGVDIAAHLLAILLAIYYFDLFMLLLYYYIDLFILLLYYYIDLFILLLYIILICLYCYHILYRSAYIIIIYYTDLLILLLYIIPIYLYYYYTLYYLNNINNIIDNRWSQPYPQQTRRTPPVIGSTSSIVYYLPYDRVKKYVATVHCSVSRAKERR